MEDSVGVTFTRQELWVLQESVRHGIASEETWRKFPPASLDLNDTIAEALLVCETHDFTEYTIPLCRGDLLVIDHNVSQKAKDGDGKIAGKAILLKTFQARRELALGPDLTSCREYEPSQERWEALRSLTSTKETPDA